MPALTHLRVTVEYGCSPLGDPEAGENTPLEELPLRPELIARLDLWARRLDLWYAEEYNPELVEEIAARLQAEGVPLEFDLLEFEREGVALW